MTAFSKAWKIVKGNYEDEPDCECITTDMSGKCTHCGKTEAEGLNEREGGGWEDCPDCGVGRKTGKDCPNKCKAGKA